MHWWLGPSAPPSDLLRLSTSVPQAPSPRTHVTPRPPAARVRTDIWRRASAHTSSMESISTVSDEPLLPESASPPPPRQLTRLRSHRVLLVVRSATKMKKSGEAKGGLAAKGAQQRTFLSGSYRMLTNNPVYVMLVFVPPALLSALLGMSDGAVFALSCCAILPLAGLLGDATEQVPAARRARCSLHALACTLRLLLTRDHPDTHPEPVHPPERMPRIERCRSHVKLFTLVAVTLPVALKGRYSLFPNVPCFTAQI